MLSPLNTPQQKLPETLFQDLCRYIACNYEDPVTWICSMEESCDFAPVHEASLRRSIHKTEKAIPSTLAELLEQQDMGFSEKLLELIDKSGQKDSEIYKKAGLTKQHFSKIRSNPHYRPTKPTAISLALALELDLQQTNDLLSRAGFTLSNSSKFDLIIRYFIQRKIFNIVEINLALYEFDQPLLGA